MAVLFLSDPAVTPPIPELPVVMSSLWRFAVRFPPEGLTGLLFLGDLPCLRGDLSLHNNMIKGNLNDKHYLRGDE